MDSTKTKFSEQNNELLKNATFGDTDSIIKIAENYLLYNDNDINNSKEILGYLEIIIDKDQEINKKCNTLLKNKKNITPTYISMGQLLTSMNIYIKILEKKDRINLNEARLKRLLKERIERMENFLTEEIGLEKNNEGKYTSSPLVFGPVGESIIFVPTNGNAYQTKQTIHGQEAEKIPFNKEGDSIPIFIPTTGDNFWKDKYNHLNKQTTNLNNQSFKTIQKPILFSINNNSILQENNNQHKIPRVYYPTLNIQENNNQYKMPQIYYPNLDSVDQIIQKNNSYLQKYEKYSALSNNIKNLNIKGSKEEKLTNNLNNINSSSKEIESNINSSSLLPKYK